MDAIEKRAREIVAAQYSGEFGKFVRSMIVEHDYVMNSHVHAAINAVVNVLTTSNEVLRSVERCAYPVAEDVDSRGHQWCEAWLDEALPQVRACIVRPEAP